MKNQHAHGMRCVLFFQGSSIRTHSWLCSARCVLVLDVDGQKEIVKNMNILSMHSMKNRSLLTLRVILVVVFTVLAVIPNDISSIPSVSVRPHSCYKQCYFCYSFSVPPRIPLVLFTPEYYIPGIFFRVSCFFSVGVSVVLSYPLTFDLPRTLINSRFFCFFF